MFPHHQRGEVGGRQSDMFGRETPDRDKTLNRLGGVETGGIINEQPLSSLQGDLIDATCLILKVFSNNTRPFTSVSTLSSAVTLHPGSALLLQLTQLRLALLQLPLQKLQLFLVRKEAHESTSGSQTPTAT